MHPKNISIQDYTYQLPDSQIAYYPLQERDQSRLLIIEGNDIAEDIYKNIDQHIESGSLVVFNNTKVVEARLRFKKETGGEIEIFCLEPAPEYADITTAMQQTEKVNWCCLVGGASKWKTGQVLEKEIVSGEKIIRLQARMTGKLNNAFLIELTWNRVDMSFAEILPALFPCLLISKEMQIRRMLIVTKPFMLIMKDQWRHLLRVYILRRK